MATPQSSSPQTTVNSDCKHSQTRNCIFTARNGVTSIRIQCLRCGDKVGDISKRSMIDVVGQLPAWDQTIRDRWCKWISEQWARKHQEEREREKAVFDEWYGRYLLTPQWRSKRDQVLVRDKYLCQGCLLRRATQVHHLTYVRVGREMLFDLISVCEFCHDAIHAKDEEGGA